MDTSNIASNGLGDMTPSSPRKISRNSWKSAIFIIFVEMAERFAYYGVSGNLITYLTNIIGMPTATAAKSVNVWHGVSAIFPLFGAFVADSYLGRFKAILIASIIYLMGLVLLTISVSAIPLDHREPVFFLALYILSVGEGGHKPCVQTFAADQFDEDLPEEKKAKSSFFNWWFLGIVTGSTSAILVVIYVEEYVGWAIGFGMPTVAVAGALVLFLMGRKTYRRADPIGSPFTRLAQVVVAAARKRRLSEVLDGRGICYEDESSGARILALTSQFRFLDKATIIDETDEASKKRNNWRLCSVNQVEELKLLLRLFPIWISCFTFAIVLAQLGTYFTKQGSTMSRPNGPHFHLPPASFQVITGLTILVTLPIYDQLLVPIARKITKHPTGITMLQRMGIGIFLSVVQMVVAALIEAKRVNIAKKHGLMDAPKIIVPMGIWWLIPQYVISGLCDVFTVVGMQELFYDQMPEEMRSVGAALYISTVGVGSFMSSGVISVVQMVSSRCGGGDGWLSGDNLNRAHLDYFYWVLAGLSGLNLCVYVWVAKGFVYKKVDCEDVGDA